MTYMKHPVSTHAHVVTTESPFICVTCGTDWYTGQRAPAPDQRKPIVIRSTRPRGNGEFDEIRAALDLLDWPVIILDHEWEVVGS